MTNKGPTLGILMLEGKMADVKGCMVNDETFPYKVIRKVVKGATTPYSQEEAQAMLPLYLDAAKELESEGVDVITANCGLIALMQKELSSVVDVPVVTSALMLAPSINQTLAPNAHIGILTFYTDAIGEKNFNASGWSSDNIPVKISGVEDSDAWLEFLRTKEMSPDLKEKMRKDLKNTIDRMLEEEPNIRAFISECTMLPAILEDIRNEIDRPIFDILSILDFSLSGYSRMLTPKKYGVDRL